MASSKVELFTSLTLIVSGGIAIIWLFFLFILAAELYILSTIIMCIMTVIFQHPTIETVYVSALDTIFTTINGATLLFSCFCSPPRSLHQTIGTVAFAGPGGEKSLPVLAAAWPFRVRRKPSRRQDRKSARKRLVQGILRPLRKPTDDGATMDEPINRRRLIWRRPKPPALFPFRHFYRELTPPF
jgi:hypothetical protein